MNFEKRPKKAREDWWDKEYEQIEELNRTGRHDLVYDRVARLTWKKNNHSNQNTVKDSAGVLLTDQEEGRARWKEYIEILYDKQGKQKMNRYG